MGNLLRRDRVKATLLKEAAEEKTLVLASTFQEKPKRLLVVRRRVHVEIKAGIVPLAKGRTGRQRLKEFLKRFCARILQLREK